MEKLADRLRDFSKHRPYHSDERFEALEMAVLHLLDANGALHEQQKKIIIQIATLKSEVHLLKNKEEYA